MRWFLRRLLPPRSGWLHLFSSFSGSLLGMSFFLVAFAKAQSLANLKDLEYWPFWWIGAVSLDALVYFGLAALFTLGESFRPWLRTATWPISLLVALGSLGNCLYLEEAGEQLNLEKIRVGTNRMTDVLEIAGNVLMNNLLFFGVAVLAFVVIPVGLWAIKRTLAGTTNSPIRHRQGAHSAAMLAFMGLVVSILWPRPSLVTVYLLRRNALMSAYLGWVMRETRYALNRAGFHGYPEPEILDASEIERLKKAKNRPNILMIVLEGTRFDFTSLAPAGRRHADTPNLLELARTGTTAMKARAVVPHTSKAIFAIMCGRYPTLQTEILEHSRDLAVQCLPAILSDAGYHTAFIQSALGHFEDRPRLVGQLGFKFFLSAEDIGGEKTGYLSSDDLSLVEPVEQWIDAVTAGARPFFLTVLTSATHHPYGLPKSVPARGASTKKERYGRLVEAEDELVGQILKALEKRKLRRNTLVLVMSDHGEGFGEKGILCHDSNYFEEVLHVPLVLSGPGVPVRRLHHNVSLVDVVPTILTLLGANIRTEALPYLAGRNIFSGEHTERRIIFSCWSQFDCRGFVMGNHKVVQLPLDSLVLHFDLEKDPEERNAGMLPDNLVEPLNHAIDVFLRHYAGKHRVDWPEVAIGNWYCEAGKKCIHKNNPWIHLLERYRTRD